LFLKEGNNQTATSIKDKQTKDSGIIQDPNIIGRELFVIGNQRILSGRTH